MKPQESLDQREIPGVAELGSALADDPRVILAAERTLLAWIRTGLALMGFGFIVARFGLLIRELPLPVPVETTSSPNWSVWIGASLVMLGTATNVMAALQHHTYLSHARGSSIHFRGGIRLGLLTAWVLSALGLIMTARLLFL